MNAGKVVVVGSVNVDLAVTVERLPVAGETVTGGRFAVSGGGKGANQAVAAARAGAEVSLIGAVGNDDYGEAARRSLSSAGVDVEGLVSLDEPTGIALITVERDGDNQIAVASGANEALLPGQVTAPVAGRTGPGSVLLLTNELSEEVNLAAVEAAAEGTTVILDPAPSRPLPAELLAAGPILTPNELELNMLISDEGLSLELAAVRLSELTNAPVVITRGPDGALLLDGDGPRLIQAPAVKAVEATGAGDTLAGTLAAGLAAGRPLEDSLREAIAAASESVTRPGSVWAL